MPNGTPFIFCRYVAQKGEETLDAAGLLAALNEVQGTYLPSGPKAEKDGTKTILVMRPRRLTIESEEVVTWAIGHRPGHRTVTDYDATKQEMSFSVQNDTHIFYCSIMAIPRLGAMAVMDRTNAMNMGARPALSRTRAAFRQIEDGAFSYSFLKPGDVAAFAKELALTEYSYTARRINPTSPGALAAAFDESMKKEGVGRQSGVLRPEPGGAMQSAGGNIEATAELAGAGYAVAGFKGVTKGGQVAQIRKPPFSMDKRENLKQMEREHPLRVFIDAEDGDDALMASLVTELVRFYGSDGATRIPEEPA